MNFLFRTVVALLYFGFQVTGYLIYLVPFVIKRFAATVLAWIWFHIVPLRRDVMLLNVSLVFTRRLEESNTVFKHRCEDLVMRNMRHMLLMLLEILERFAWTDETVAKKVDWHGYPHLKKLMDSKKGYFVLSAHLGNWELITRAACAIGVPVTIITRFLRNPILDAVWVRSRKRFGLELLSESGSGLAVVRAVQRGRALGFISDQHTGQPHGIKTEFLGLEAWCPKALALMADRLKAPILPAFILRDPQTGVFTPI
jgi:Kdo2-lipid IVA lauroyltransferase/acyltransferase